VEGANFGLNIEHLKVDRSQYKASHTMPHTSLVKSTIDEFDVWTATAYGNEADNPVDATKTRLSQWNKAVTFDFAEFSEMDVTFDSTDGLFPRFLGIALSPGVKCLQPVLMSA